MPITTVDLRRWFDDIVRRGVRQHLSVPELRFHALELGVHGRYLNCQETGTGARILISYVRRMAGELAVYDTLVHEVAHHAVFELCCEDDGDHGTVFCNVANEMAVRLGYKGTVKPHSRDAKFWPGCLR